MMRVVATTLLLLATAQKSCAKPHLVTGIKLPIPNAQGTLGVPSLHTSWLSSEQSSVLDARTQATVTVAAPKPTTSYGRDFTALREGRAACARNWGSRRRSSPENFQERLNMRRGREDRQAGNSPGGWVSGAQTSAPATSLVSLGAAVLFRGGGRKPGKRRARFLKMSDSDSDSSSSSSEGQRQGRTWGIVRWKRDRRKDGILLDFLEDILGDVASAVKFIALPAFHVLRLNFGLSLMFYGMAFRTFAFHVIVFRIAGLRQVRKSLAQIVDSYRSARQAIREAASMAEELGDNMTPADKMENMRGRMIEEKRRLMKEGGCLTEEDTAYFMKKYRKQLQEIADERSRSKAKRSTIDSVVTSLDPRGMQGSIAGIYSAIVASFTASSLELAGQITLGLHVGGLLKTHILDMLGPILDPIGYRLELEAFFDEEEIPYMGKANAMAGRSNLLMNIFSYSLVFIVFHLHPSIAMKTSMVYYGARVVTDYIVYFVEPILRKCGKRSIRHTPYSATIHTSLSVLAFCCHRNVLFKLREPGVQPLDVGPGLIGLMEPFVRFMVWVSELLHHIDFFTVRFVEDPVEAVSSLRK